MKRQVNDRWKNSGIGAHPDECFKVQQAGIAAMEQAKNTLIRDFTKSAMSALIARGDIAFDNVPKEAVEMAKSTVKALEEDGL